MNTFEVIAILLAVLHVGHAIEFTWSSTNNGQCVVNDTMLGLCSKERDIQCIMKTNGQSLPDYYCRLSGIPNKPISHVSCMTKECGQGCIMSTWSKWNLCDPACVVSFKYRTRSILWRMNKDDICPSLIERETCAHCKNISGKEINLWQVDKWGTCWQFTTIPVLQRSTSNTTPLNTNGGVCGPSMNLGKQARQVRCVNAKNGQEIETDKCFNSKDKYGRITQRPDRNKVCRLPCDCHLSGWGNWSGCPRDCSTTEEYRTRDVLYAAQLDGKPCGNLVERRPCSSQNCGVYKWSGIPWGECMTQNAPAFSRSPLVCGYGYQTRDHVFCVSSNGNSMVPVNDEHCDPAKKLPLRRSCVVPCPKDCTVSEWQPWEECSVSCGRLGTRKRLRTVIERASHGGLDCPNLVEISPCGQINCTSWFTTLWSICLAKRCGTQGQKMRATYCHDANGYLNPRNCSHVPKPASATNCSNPCGYDCALSVWSEWGPCSKSCGMYGGIQRRYKKILAYPQTGKQPCPKSDQLVETRKCNLHTFCERDSNYMWKTRPWGTCATVVNGTCGESKGYRKRIVTCGSITNSVLNDSLCTGIPKPITRESCNITCENDCVLTLWQKWSDCNQTCDRPGSQIRKRFVLQYPTLGGLPCTSGVTNGVQVEIRQCSRKLSCYHYKWLPSNWSVCTLLSPPQSQEMCGAGYQNRTISCVRSDGRVVEPFYCYKALLTLPPEAIKECWKPCAQSCVRSAWSSWSACPQTCTEGKPPVYRHKRRTVVGLSPARGGFSTACPDLKPIDFFSEKVLCPALPCISFKWHIGSWQSCIRVGGCGQGRKEREVICQRNDGALVSDNYCSNNTRPLSWKQCSLVCNEDCIVGKWKPWSACAEPCGDSIQTRNRSVISPKVGLGKECPPLIQKQLCHRTSCIDYTWSVTEWNTCKPDTKGAICGKGIQRRKVLCLPDKRREDICLRQSPKPTRKQFCELACPGDCVLSNWAPWANCVNGFKGCTRKRWRTDVRPALPLTGRPCSNITQETVSCECPTAKKLVISDWTSCQLNDMIGMMCGDGVQFRSIKCIGTNGEQLDDIHCSKRMLHKSQKCVIKCPVDCVTSVWTEWSKCSEQCGANRITKRTRKILVDGTNGGQKCPDGSGLVQTKPCSIKPCGGYSLDKGAWSRCYIDGQGYGYGTKTREVVCRGSDGIPVEMYHCLKEYNRFPGVLSQLDKLEILNTVLNNITKLSVTLKQSCTDPCPGNCVFIEWSEWSKCGRSCFDKSGTSYQSRTRLIITPAAVGGRACPTNLSETKRCQTTDPCIGAEWKTGPWQNNDSRDVWCGTTNGVRVSETCIMKIKPTSSKLCTPACKDPNAHCKDGVCVCKPLYESFQNECIPNNGCLHDRHCVYQNTACIKNICKCKQGYAINSTTDECERMLVQELPSTTRTISSTESVGNNEISTDSSLPSTPANSSLDDVEKEAVESDDGVAPEYIKWIGITVGVLLFCILLVIGVFCYTRRYKKAKKQKYNPERGNSIELIGMQSIQGDETLPAKV